MSKRCKQLKRHPKTRLAHKKTLLQLAYEDYIHLFFRFEDQNVSKFKTKMNSTFTSKFRD